MLSFYGMTDVELSTIKADKTAFVHKVLELMAGLERIAMALQINVPRAQYDEIQSWIDAIIVWANPPTPDYMPIDVQAWGIRGGQLLTQGEHLLLKYLPRGTPVDSADLHALLDVPGEYPVEKYNPIWSTAEYQQAIASGVNPDTAEKIVTQVMPEDRQAAIVQAVQEQGTAYVPQQVNISAVTTGVVAPISIPPVQPIVQTQVTPPTQTVTITVDDSSNTEVKIDKKMLYAGGALLLLLLLR